MSLANDMARRRAAGFGFGPDDVWVDSPPVYDPGGSSGSSSGDGDGGSHDIPWYVAGAPVFGVIGKTLSNIFGNQYQQPTYLQPRTQQYPPGSYYPPGYDSTRLAQQSFGNITSFISNNFLLVSAGVLGVILLFRQPPGRR